MKKLHIIRNKNYKISPVTSISSNEEVLAVFRKEKTMEIIDGERKDCLLSIFTDMEIKYSRFLDKDCLICLSKNGNISRWRKKESKLEILLKNISCFGICEEKIENLMSEFYYLDTQGVLGYFSEKLQVESLGKIPGGCTMFVRDDILVAGSRDGSLYCYQIQWKNPDRKVPFKTELLWILDIGEEIKTLFSVSFVRCAFATSGGMVGYVDIDSGTILSKTYARRSSLNGLVCFSGFLHVSGADSRIICYRIVDDKIVRMFQGDCHFSEVTSMCIHRGAAVTGGGEGRVVFSNINKENTGYLFEYIESSFFRFGSSQNYFYTSSLDSIDLYDINKTQKSNLQNIDSEDSLNRTRNNLFEIEMDRIIHPSPDIRHIMKIRPKGKIISVETSSSGEYLAYSTMERTYLYRIAIDSTSGKKEFSLIKIGETGSSFRISLGEKYILCVTGNFEAKVCLLAHLEDVLCTYLLRNISSRVVLASERILAPDDGYEININKCEGNIEKIPWKKPTQEKILSIVVKEDKTLFLTPKRIISSDGSEFSFGETNGKLFIISKKAVLSLDSLVVEDGGIQKKYWLRQVVHGGITYLDDIVVFQDNFEVLRGSCINEIFKEKYSTH